ncbi:CLUMA_CG016963, isoform A [Clunio marinus]|uniref:CLUMA_CG016963, isoform A n=1 Tax=Clunio marinus TaxID=568069 RepID=A0A1J1IUF4_9DIPT|nr:CLUMA_CG016963, isoform A [Clunio marinus]
MDGDRCHMQSNGVSSKIHNMFSWFQIKSKRRDCDVETGKDVEIDDEVNADFYCFDHGSMFYYRTTDCPPQLTSEIYAQRVFNFFTKFWAEIFGSINIVVTFFTTFGLQLYRFLLYGIIRVIIIGIVQISSDYLLKPLLAVLFNGLLQPLFVLLQNIFQSLRNMFGPLVNLMADVFKPLIDLVKAFRVIEVKNLTKELRESTPYQTFQGQHET